MTRSPRASMKIADSAVDTPATRGQPVQSTPSRASAASTWSPVEYEPAGAPTGHAARAAPGGAARGPGGRPPPAERKHLDNGSATVIDDEEALRRRFGVRLRK